MKRIVCPYVNNDATICGAEIQATLKTWATIDEEGVVDYDAGPHYIDVYCAEDHNFGGVEVGSDGFATVREAVIDLLEYYQP